MIMIMKYTDSSGTPRGMSYAQQAVIHGRELQEALPPNTFSYGFDDGGPSAHNPRRGMPRAGALPTPLETLAGVGRRGGGGGGGRSSRSADSVAAAGGGGRSRLRTQTPVSHGG